MYESAWPGIDVVVDHASATSLKATYLLQSGANPAQIRLRWHGASARIAESGALELTTPLGILWERAPVAWQEHDGRRVPVAVRFALLDLMAGPPEGSSVEVGFELGTDDPALPLVVDPAIEYATYLGGNGADVANDVAVDGCGRAYVVGTTQSSQATFPDGDGFGTIPGADQSSNGGTDDAWVARLDLSAPSAGFTVSPTSGLVTTEAGGQATFTVRLNTIPTAVVTLALSSNDTTEGTVSPASLTFQPDSTALTNQTVTVTGVDDALVDGAIAYTIITAAAVSTDPAYSGRNPANVAVSNQDNDVACPNPRPRVVLTVTKGATGFLNVTVEAGHNSIATIEFGTPRPNANARVSVVGGPQNQAGAFTFTPTNSPTTVQFTVRSPNRALATMVYLVVTDGCGAWPAFVGGGAGSF